MAERGKNTVELVTGLVTPIVERLGLILWDVRYEKEGTAWFLRVFIDKAEEPVSTEDCEAVSRPLSDMLDELDPIPQSYYLEVSSPGLDRQLRKPEHFEKSEGMDVLVRLIRPYEGVRDFAGNLAASNEKEFSIIPPGKTEAEAISFTYAECAFVKLDFQF